MVTTIRRGADQGAAPGSLEDLARQADQLGAQPAEPPSADELAQQAEADKAAAALQEACRSMLLKALQAVRTRVARNLPEISRHWADADLDNVATAAVPVGRKYLARLMPMADQFPEEAALAVAALPLVLGYVSAVSDHDEALAGKVGNALGAASDQVRAHNVVQLVPDDGA